MNDVQFSHIRTANGLVKVNLDQPLDISIPVSSSGNVAAWYVDAPKIDHVEVDGYVGKVSLGGSTNFNTVHFNPHSHGTHTECVGHITEEFRSVNKVVEKTFHQAIVISVTPEKRGEDLVITDGLFDWDTLEGVEAVVIRTLPNPASKKQKNYSNTNPPYLEERVAIRFRESGIQHLLIDLPSVDKERDDGKLLAHKAFWNYDQSIREAATITELVYVPQEIEDGPYLLNLQVAPFENNAAPSRPILYRIQS